ncbi:unnamed protein product [Closterium sp. NIES-53]
MVNLLGPLAGYPTFAPVLKRQPCHAILHLLPPLRPPAPPYPPLPPHPSPHPSPPCFPTTPPSSFHSSRSLCHPPFYSFPSHIRGGRGGRRGSRRGGRGHDEGGATAVAGVDSGVDLNGQQVRRAVHVLGGLDSRYHAHGDADVVPP